MESNELPQDPAILMSYINTLLRDRYASLDELCEDTGINCEALVARLAQALADSSVISLGWLKWVLSHTG